MGIITIQANQQPKDIHFHDPPRKTKLCLINWEIWEINKRQCLSDGKEITFGSCWKIKGLRNQDCTVVSESYVYLTILCCHYWLAVYAVGFCRLLHQLQGCDTDTLVINVSKKCHPESISNRQHSERLVVLKITFLFKQSVEITPLPQRTNEQLEARVAFLCALWYTCINAKQVIKHGFHCFML